MTITEHKTSNVCILGYKAEYKITKPSSVWVKTPLINTNYFSLIVAIMMLVTHLSLFVK